MEQIRALKEALDEAKIELDRSEFYRHDSEVRLKQAEVQVAETRDAYDAAVRAYVSALEREANRGKAEASEPQLRHVAVGAEFEELVIRAASRSAEEQLVALAEIKRMGSAGIENLLSLLGAYERKRQGRWNWVGFGAIGVAGVAVAQILFNLPLEALNVGLLGLCLSAGLVTRPLGRHRKALQVLAKLDDARLAPIFMDVLISSDLETRRVALKGLERLLPRIAASDAYLFNSLKRTQLGQVLRDSQTPGLALGVLSCIEQVDAREALEDVIAVAQGRTLHRDWAEVLRTATAVQHALVERRADARAGGTLLRAVNAPDTATLVRPASVTDSDPAQLLRPASVE